jgi:hypothetical protein
MNKGVKHCHEDAGAIAASIDFNGPNPHSKKNGARVNYPRPAHTNC